MTAISTIRGTPRARLPYSKLTAVLPDTTLQHRIRRRRDRAHIARYKRSVILLETLPLLFRDRDAFVPAFCVWKKILAFPVYLCV